MQNKHTPTLSNGKQSGYVNTSLIEFVVVATLAVGCIAAFIETLNKIAEWAVK